MLYDGTVPPSPGFVVRSALLALLVLAAGARAGEPVRITSDGSFKQHLQWSPDGAVPLHPHPPGQDGPVDDGRRRLRPRRGCARQDTPHFDGHWSPDGKKVVFVLDVLQGTDGKLQIDIVNADGTDEKTLIPHKAFEESPAVVAGRVKGALGQHPRRQPGTVLCNADGTDDQATDQRGRARPAPGLVAGRQADRVQPAAGRAAEIHVMDADGSDVKRLTDGDGPGLVAGLVAGRQADRVHHQPRRELRHLPDERRRHGPGQPDGHPAQDTSPAWSPDGKKLAFISDRSGASEVYVLPVK